MPVPISCVVGARPNFMKMAAILDALGRRPRFQTRLIHTGQHFSPEMSDWFFRDLGLPRPDTYLDAGGGTASEQTAEVMKRIEPEFAAHPPQLVVVVGDVNSTLAAALVAAKHGIAVAHVEAGLRSFDRRQPDGERQSKAGGKILGTCRRRTRAGRCATSAHQTEKGRRPAYALLSSARRKIRLG